VAGVLLAALPVGADTYTWDNNTTPPAGNGAGPWDTTTAHWDNGASDVLWPNSLSDTAVFGLGGAIGNSASLVTVDAGGVQVGNITFNYTDTYIWNRYTLQTGPITLADGGTIKKIGGYADSAALISSIIHGGAVNIGDGINSGAVAFAGTTRRPPG
jgi:hypothetical protein